MIQKMCNVICIHVELILIQQIFQILNNMGLERVWNNGSGRGWILKAWTTTKAFVPWVEAGQDDYIKEICSPEGLTFNPVRL